MLVGSIVLAAIVLKLSLYGDAGVLAILVKIQLSNNKINRRTTIIISKFLYTFNYNSTAIPGTVHSAKRRFTIPGGVQWRFLLCSSLKLRKFTDAALQLSNKQNSTWPLDPFFVTGFTDAEGCFHVSITKNKNFNLGWRVGWTFIINLKEKDFVILEQIKNLFHVGSIYYIEKSKSINFQVRSL